LVSCAYRISLMHGRGLFKKRRSYSLVAEHSLGTAVIRWSCHYAWEWSRRESLSDTVERRAHSPTLFMATPRWAGCSAQRIVATRFLVAALSTRPREKSYTAASGLRVHALEMASRKVWTKEETMHLISLYKSCPAVWDNQHVHYKDREKRNACWNSMGEAMNTTSAEVQRKIHNLRNQVSVTFCCTVTQK